MKIFKSTAKKYKVAITTLSVLSLIPFGILLYHLYQLQLISTTEKQNEALVNLVLDRTISSPLILSGFIIGLIIWISNSVISSIAVHKKILPPWFGYVTLVLGGLGIHFIALFFGYVFNKIKPQEKSNRNLKRAKSIISLSFITIFVGSVTAFFALGISLKNYDSAVLGTPVEFSVDSKNTNVIEIFTDGFDQWNKEDYKADEDFKDFNWFSKFQTVGNATHRSVPSIWGNFNEMNPFQIRKDHKDLPAKDLAKVVYGESFLKAGMDHMKLHKNEFSQRSIINPICLSDDSGYSPSTSGVPEAIKNLDSDINVTNWSGARDYNAGKFGISNISPDNNAYKYFSDSSKVADTQNNGNKGAYVLLNDLITHKPYMSSASGRLTTFNTSAEDQKTDLRNNLKELFNKLKSKKSSTDSSNQLSVYDNSMIIIYGDHSNHYRKLRDANGDITKYRHSESAMMVKYPNEVHTNTQMNVIDDRVVYSASINNIISHFVDRKNDPTENNSTKQLAWIYSDSQFDNVPRPSFYDDDHFMMTKWSNPKQNIDAILEPVNYDSDGKPVSYTYDQWKAIAGSSSDPLQGMVKQYA